MPTAQEIIAQLQLTPLEPEGGYFRRTFESDFPLPVLWRASSQPVTRHSMTAIYYLMTPEHPSQFHKVRGHELFHFYGGDSAQLTLLHEDGRKEEIRLGMRVMEGEVPQAAVPPDTWQTLRVEAGGGNGWCLLGATVSPGFEYEDFAMGSKAELLRKFPQHSALIEANCAG